MSLPLFIVDDDSEYSSILKFQLKKIEHIDFHLFKRGEEALEHLHLEPIAVLLDLVMPGQGGLETLRQIRMSRPDLPVIVISSQTVVNVALEAIRLGANDYVTKGHDDILRIKGLVSHILERHMLVKEVSTLREQLHVPHGVPGMTGESASMGKVWRLIKKSLIGDLSVAITGESGTGKELVAHTIHYNSPRRREPFIIVNCAAIPRDLMESEFFGHEKGSFTGAYTRKIGKFEQANRGTIFLDEVGELNLDLQAKLLRVLQNQEVQRVGSTETLRVDVRVICATNRSIVEMIQKGAFREDLYYRLFQFPIPLPALRDRDQDAMLLANHFRTEFLRRNPNIEKRDFSRATKNKILSYNWPGNVRQLKNVVERALLIAEQEEIIESDLMLDQLSFASPTKPAETIPSPSFSSEPGKPQASSELTPTKPEDLLSIDEIKRIAILHAYKLCQGNVDQTSIRLGVTRSTIYRLLEKYKKEGFDIER